MDLIYVRKVLAAAMIVLAGCMVFLSSYAFENVIAIVLSHIVRGTAILLIVSCTIFFVATLFPASEGNEWNTLYFRYMRAVWQNHFGGVSHPYRISICPAVWMGALTLAGHIVMILFALGIGYNAYFVSFHGFQESFLWIVVEKGEGASLAVNMLFQLGIVGVICNLAFGWLYNHLVDVGVFGKKYGVLTLVSVFFIAINVFLMFVVAPIRTFGFPPWSLISAFIYWAFIIVASIVVCVAVAGLLLKLFRFGTTTMPGKLVVERLRAAKTGLCPYIVEQVEVPQSEE